MSGPQTDTGNKSFKLKIAKIMRSFTITENVVTRCKDGYVKVYINGQEEEHQYDKHDYMFCGEQLRLHCAHPALLIFQASKLHKPLTVPGPDLFYYSKLGASPPLDSRLNIDSKQV